MQKLLKTCACGHVEIFSIADKNAFKALRYGDVPISVIFPDLSKENQIFLGKNICPTCQQHE